VEMNEKIQKKEKKYKDNSIDECFMSDVCFFFVCTKINGHSLGAKEKDRQTRLQTED